MRRMKTVKVRWTETSQHEALVSIPVTADRDELDLENALADVDDEFCGLERDIDSVTEVEFDPDAHVIGVTDA